MRVKQNYLFPDREINIDVLLIIMKVITTLILRNLITLKKNNTAKQRNWNVL